MASRERHSAPRTILVERNRYAVDAATNGPSEGEHEATVHSDRLRAIALPSVRCATLAQSTNPPRAAVFFQTQEHRPKSLRGPEAWASQPRGHSTITIVNATPIYGGLAKVRPSFTSDRSRYESEQPRNHQPSKGLHIPKHFRAFVINTHQALARPDHPLTPV